MKQTLRYYAPVAALLVAILVLSVGLTALTGQMGRLEQKPVVLTTVYPLYTAAQAVIGDTDGVVLTRLTGSAGGCLHDYQLSPADRLSLQQADLLLLNGAGAEPFLEDILPTLSAAVTDTAAGLELLCATPDHGHEGHDHDHGESYNEHVWTSPTYYAEQVTRVTEALCALDPANAAVYNENGRAYRAAVLALGDRLRQAVAALPSTTCVTFHSSLEYLARDIGLTAAVTLQVGEESGISAADLSAAQQVLSADPRALLLYDSQYDLRYGELSGTAAVLNTAVTADWLTAMEQNLARLQQLTEAKL